MSNQPRYVSRTVRRQRQIVLVLASAAVVTLLLSFVPGLGFLLAAHALIDVTLALYFVALLRLKQNRPANGARPMMTHHREQPPRNQYRESHYDRAS